MLSAPGGDFMISRLMQKRIIIMLLGLITAIALSVVFLEGLNVSTSIPSIGNTLMVSYIAIPIVLLTLGIYQFKRTSNKQFLTYTISLLTSVAIVVPIIFIGFIVVFVGIFGFMPTPS
jgi:hypothetical protein